MKTDLRRSDDLFAPRRRCGANVVFTRDGNSPARREIPDKRGRSIHDRDRVRWRPPDRQFNEIRPDTLASRPAGCERRLIEVSYLFLSPHGVSGRDENASTGTPTYFVFSLTLSSVSLTALSIINFFNIEMKRDGGASPRHTRSDEEEIDPPKRLYLILNW